MEQSSCVFSIVILLVSLSLVSCDLISMGTMIDWEDDTITSLWQAMNKYNDYGCYCGFGGTGLPVDKVDCCCQVHDECYDNLAKDGTCTSGHVGVGVVYKYSKTNIKGKHTVHCSPNTDPCADGICACDKALAECFSVNEAFYQKDHKKWRGSKGCNGEKGLRAGFCPNSNQ